MTSKKYWERRAAKQMHTYMEAAERVSQEIAESYARASYYLEDEAHKVIQSFGRLTGISEAEAQRILKQVKGRKISSQLKAMVSKIENADLRKETLALLNAPAYAARLTSMENLEKAIDWQCETLYKAEKRISEIHYRGLCKEAYLRRIFEIQKETGLRFEFSLLSQKKVEQILAQKWAGGNYSSRIWANTQELAKELKGELLTGIMTGRTYDKTARNLADKMASGASQARRLVRTESCYVVGQADRRGYQECEIKKYRFVATLDLRTSEICQQHDGKEFDVEKGQVGVNLPPMHPWCRSTTIAVVNEQALKTLKRRARDPKTGKTRTIPAEMTYSDWKRLNNS